MKLGIIGLEQSGKTTVFNALTGARQEVGTYGKLESHIAMVKVPDERVDWLCGLYNPKKIAYADIEFMDIPGSINDSSDPKIVGTAREVDAFVYVIRAFENANVPLQHGDINPLRDFGYIDMGLIVADMVITEKRIERIKKELPKTKENKQEMEEELSILEKVMKQLEAEEPASEAGLTEEEEKSIRSFSLLTLKPYLTLLNVSDNAINTDETKKLIPELPHCMAMSANIEMELEKLEEGDRKAFLDDLGIKELSLHPFIQKAYETLGLISFFTVGPTEVHAWTIKKGTNAQAAAGKIHSDLERGFIRSEVMSYEALKTCGSESEVKKAGKLRLEGKDYIVQDGDIMYIKFNV